MEKKTEVKITGYTGLYGVVANPIRHSLSPMMHNLAFKVLGIDDVYISFEIKEEDFDKFIQSIQPMQIKGFNVSMPYKQKMVSYVDELTKRSQLCQAVNTVKNINGKLIGDITDGQGFFDACHEKGWSIENKKIVILGAGGASRAIIVEAATQHASEIIVYNRSYRDYVKELDQKFETYIELKSLENMDELKEDLKDAYMLIQSTNVGMKPLDHECLIPSLDYLPEHLKVVDIIYNPNETVLLKMAKEKGLDFMNGKGMILYQAAASFEFWTGQKMPIDRVKKKLEME